MVFLQPSVSAASTFQRAMNACCHVGEAWATRYSASNCQNYPHPIDDKAGGRHKEACVAIIQICCIRMFRRNTCEMGRDSARNGQDCTPLPGPGGEAHKDCCEACKLGQSWSKSGIPCSASEGFSLGNPWDESVAICCTEPTADNEINRPSQNRCIQHNPGCSQRCVDTGLAIQCECYSGYTLAQDQRTCRDLDECTAGTHTCNLAYETCLNSPGGFHCVENEGPVTRPTSACPKGYVFNVTLRTCDDVDECSLRSHTCRAPMQCVNTIGSFTCSSKAGNKNPSQTTKQQCPAGFKPTSDVDDCVDVDECAEGLDTCDRQQEDCLNTYGEYRCQPRSTSSRQCPAGYKWNERTRACEDVDECQEGLHACLAESEVCFNTAGGYNCDIRCPTGTLFHPVKRECIDIDECGERTHNCAARGQICVNTFGSYNCVQNSADCPGGYRRVPNSRSCVDIDECAEDSHDCNDIDQSCVNTAGGFQCDVRNPVVHCGPGYAPDSVNGNCQDVNECQLDQHSCVQSQRCDNTIGSYTCVRVSGCGTGYTLNAGTGECEDDDECVLGKHNCGPGFACRNSAGNFRCHRVSCPFGQKLLPDGTCFAVNCPTGMEPDTVGNCIDINECLTKRCRSSQFCVNSVGSFRCENLLTCGAGYELDPSGTQCLDVDECRKGVHECGQSQICRNRAGGYSCECPAGYVINADRECEDINECTHYHGQTCSQNSDCQNTPGSYICNCKDGFRKLENSQNCVDIDECSQTANLCQHTCVNVWGTYQCTCRPGFKLAPDNRSCSDMDECELYEGKGNLCIGICVNTPGSFSCSCPSGYRLASDQRTCQDINECQEQGVCQGENQVCLNTRGDYKCNTVDCPAGYVRDKDHKNRCKRSRLDCRRGDSTCLQEPLSFSFNYLTIVSKMRLPPAGQLDLFTMRGPRLSQTSVEFTLQLVRARADPSTPSVASREHFHLRRTAFNEAMISLVQSPDGPQEIELDLTMKMFHNGLFGGTAVAKLFIFVSEYEF